MLQYQQKNNIRGSRNQKFHFFNNRYNMEYMKRHGDVEIIFISDGSIMITGFVKVEI